MTIILVFLIKSFSAEGNLVTPTADLILPLSVSQDAVRPIESIEITSTAIVAHGEVITEHTVFSENDSLLIEPLAVWINVRYGKQEKSDKKREVMIQSDRDVPFNIVKRVMYTFSQAGVSEFTVLVMNEE